MQADDQPELSPLAQLFVLRDDTVFGRIIVQAAKTELLLEQLLKAKLVNGNDRFEADLFSGYGPMATFGAKINMSFGLGIVDEAIWKRLKQMKDVRNAFAHSAEHIDFGHPTFRSLKKLQNNPMAKSERDFFDGLVEIIEHLAPQLQNAALVRAIMSRRAKSGA